MRLLRARVIGFQSFGDSGDVAFGDGINLIVGQNNAGKSAMLRALQPELMDDRHRTPEIWDDFRLPLPDVSLTIDISGSELRDSLLLRGGDLFIPSPDGQSASDYAQELLTESSISVTVTHRSGAAFTSTYPAHGRFAVEPGRQHACALVQVRNGELNFAQQFRGDDSVPLAIHDAWQRKMFYFSAERMNVGVSASENVQRLLPNAQNLPSVLLTLAGDRGDLFRRIVGHLQEVFPTIGNLSIRPVPGLNTVEVRVWPTEAMERVQLSFPLLQSGTGVAQVIAILTAVMTVDHSVIVIDEINSFLHPAAVKALLRILQTEYANHQYIISTHAPEVIGFSNPRTIHLVKRAGYESSITKLDLAQVDAFREVAEHLGVSMADVFAADRVIWVEGPTEELCFPLLYQQAAGQPQPHGTIFTSVIATGDFLTKRRDKDLIYHIYRRLSQVAVPLVVSVAFSFDSEKLTEGEKSAMIDDSHGAMHFLPRRHIECYLVNPTAIAAFINGRDQGSDAPIAREAVEAKLAELAGSEKHNTSEWKGDLFDPAWLAGVDAANLIADTCGAISEHRVTFNKKDDTLALLQAVQVQSPEQIKELCSYVKGLVESVTE